MLRLRNVDYSDCALLFAWANDPDTRRSSLCPEPVTWEPHCAWLQRKMRDPHCRFFLALNADEAPVGQIRFDICETRATVSVSLDAAQRGRGYSVPLITQGIKALRSQAAATEIVAWIKPENLASQRAFERAGFHSPGAKCLNGLSLCHYVFTCSP